MSNPLNHLINGEMELFKQSIHATLYSKVSDALQERKQQLATDLFAEECSECGDNVQEETKEQKFAKLAPPYDEITYADKIAGATKGKTKGKKGKKK